MAIISLIAAVIGIHFALYGTAPVAAVTCPNCGNATVPYPLSTGESCGDGNYKILCNATQSRLSFPAVSGTYPIISINSAAQRLVVAAPAIETNACATPDLAAGGLLLNSSLPFNVTSSNTIFLLNCSSNLLRSPLNCSSNNLCAQYLNQSSAGAPCHNGNLCCTFTAGGSSTSYKIGVQAGQCTAYVSVLGANPAVSADKWSYGVELEWVLPPEPVCRQQADCGKFSTCELVAGSSLSRCLCVGGHYWDAIVGECVAVSGAARRRRLLAGVAGGVAAACVIALVAVGAFLVLRRRRLEREAKDRLTRERQKILSEGLPAGSAKAARLYSSSDMRKATNNFAKDRLLGSGGFGEVYKGVLPSTAAEKRPPLEVAVKSAKVGNTKGVDQVLNEVRVLSQVNHKGLVALLGCCVETETPLLVYEYISNGTLLDHLSERSGRTFLPWAARLRVAAQTADALAYLHSAAQPPIIHRDVKSSNILLDARLNAKVSDFGLSRLAVETDISHISTCAQGTLGYLDPEYYRNYQLTAKSDVYSFGIVLLELVTSQRAIDFNRGIDDVNLAVYVSSKHELGRIEDVFDGRLLQPPVESECLLRVALLALRCLSDSRGDRPGMKEVAEELNSAVASLPEEMKAEGGFFVTNRVSDFSSGNVSAADSSSSGPAAVLMSYGSRIDFRSSPL